MTQISARDFCLWLDQFLGDGACAPTAEEAATIRLRLADVFLHEIDPAMGDAAHQAALQRLHRGVH